MVDTGHKPIWDGPIEQTPWWWPLILQIEKYIDGLRQSAAYDYEKKPPPKEMWTMKMADRLEDEWYEPRRKEGERQSREKKPMQDW